MERKVTLALATLAFSVPFLIVGYAVAVIV